MLIRTPFPSELITKYGHVHNTFVYYILYCIRVYQIIIYVITYPTNPTLTYGSEKRTNNYQNSTLKIKL